MSEGVERFPDAARAGQEQGFEVLDKLFTVARPGAVFGEPVSAAGRTIITASEVTVGMGLGFGFGGGPGPGEPGPGRRGRGRRG